MISKFFFVIKKVIMASLVIYAYDAFFVALKPSIPINFFTILLVSIFDIPAMIGLILFSFAF